jgi:hypothetical protein
MGSLQQHRGVGDLSVAFHRCEKADMMTPGNAEADRRGHKIYTITS